MPLTPTVDSCERPTSLLPRDQTAASTPVTPIRRKYNGDHNETPTSSQTTQSTPSSSIRERRGRRHFRDDKFRPLSIFTRSVLFPFALDTDKALEVLKGDSPDRIEEAKAAASIDKSQVSKPEGDIDLDLTEKPRRRNTVLTRASSIFGEEDKMMQQRATHNMDLLTALQTTSPDKDSPQNLRADFAVLYQLPAPEASEHPSNSSDPFKVKTDYPLLYTSTNLDEIRSYNVKNRRNSQARVGRESIERKKSFFGLDLRTPSSTRIRNAFASEDSPAWSNITPSTSASQTSLSRASPLAMEFVSNKETSGSQSANSSVRKFSDIFKRKSMERGSDTSGTSPRQSQDSPNLDRYDLVSQPEVGKLVSLLTPSRRNTFAE